MAVKHLKSTVEGTVPSTKIAPVEEVPSAEGTVNILAGFGGKVVFALLVIVAAGMTYRSCDGRPELWSVPDAISSLKLLIIIPTLGLLAFTHAEGRGEFIEAQLLIAFVYGPLVAFLLFVQPLWLFVINAALFLIAVFVETFPEEGEGWFLSVMHSLGVLWAASSLGGLLINLKLVPEYKVQALAAQVGVSFGIVASYLNLRLILGTLFVAVLLTASIIRAFREAHPVVPHIPLPPRATPSRPPNGVLASLLYPFLLVFDAGVAVLRVSLNVLWLAGATIVAYLFRIAANLADYLRHLILRRRLWIGSLRVVALYALVYFFAKGVGVTLPALQRYLTTDIHFTDFYLWGDLGSLATFCLLLLLGVAAHFLVFNAGGHIFPDGQKLRAFMQRQAFASAMIAVGYFCASGLIYVLTHLKLTEVKGYGVYGPLSLVTFVFIAAISLVFLVTNN